MATEQEIKDAMQARGDWFVPVLISDLRQTADKGLGAIVHPPCYCLFLVLFTSAGKPSVVIDAVFHSSLKKRCGINSEFKMFLIRTCCPRNVILRAVTVSFRTRVPTHRGAVQLSVVTLHRDAKHRFQGEVEPSDRAYPSLPLRPQRKAGVGHTKI